MALKYMPLLREREYEQLSGVMHLALPATYKAWLTLCADLERGHWPPDIVYVEVEPARFLEYMSHAGRKPDLGALLEYVAFNPWSSGR